MKSEKRALMCVFKPEKIKTTAEMREWFIGSYPRFLEMDTLEFKCWWCSQEKQEWGAFYIFKSEEALEAYVQSDIWRKVVPEKYGCVPIWEIVEPGPVISKKEITSGTDSWISG